MRKRALSLFISLCLMLTLAPAAFAAELTPLGDPTDLTWGRDYDQPPAEDSPYAEVPGSISWKTARPDQNQAKITIYKEGQSEPISSINWDFGSTEDDAAEYRTVDDFILKGLDSGTYYFTVQSMGDGTQYQDSTIVTSPTWTYTKPEAQLSRLEQGAWEWPNAVFAAPTDDSQILRYQIRFLFSETATGTPVEIGYTVGRFGSITQSCNIEDEYVQEHGNGYYYFQTRALSNDITAIQNSPWSALSPAYNLGATSDSLKDQLTAIKNMDSSSAETIRNAVQNLNTEELASALLADKDGTGVTALLRDIELKNEGMAAIVQYPSEEESADLNEAFSGKVSVIGAGLNKVTGNEQVKLKIDKPENERHTIPAAYDNALALRFSMSLEGVEQDTSLSVPVKITLPVPKTINPDFLVILHYSNDSSNSPEEIQPYLYQENGEWYATFVLTHFSDFIMTQTIPPAATIGDKGYDTIGTAITAAQSGATIKLQKDVAEDVTIPENITLTLDLNGYKLTNVSSHTIYNKGTLTITDSSAEKTGTVDNVTHAKGAVYNNTGATCTILAGNYTRSKENGQSAVNNGGNSWYVIKNFGTMTIGQENGSNDDIHVFFNGAYSSLVANGWQNGANAGKGSEPAHTADATLTIYNGTFDKGINTIKNDDYGKLIIKGGVFENVAQHAVMNWNDAAIKGGTFTSSGNSVIWNGYAETTDNMNQGKLSISGGTFTAPARYNVVYSNNATSSDNTTGADVTITGGSYVGGALTNATDPYNSGQGAVIQKDGSFQVANIEGLPRDNNGKIYADGEAAEANSAAKIVTEGGTNYYSSLSAAITAAQTENTIVLLNDVVTDKISNISAGVTIDGQSKYSITATGTIGSGALIDVLANDVTIKNITINTDGKAKHGVQFYCVTGGLLENVTVNGGTFTSVLVNGSTATVNNSVMNPGEGAYANIEYGMGGSVTTIPNITLNNVSGSSELPLVYVDDATLTAVKTNSNELSESSTNADVIAAINKQLTGTQLSVDDKGNVVTPKTYTITFDPNGHHEDSAPASATTNNAGNLTALPTLANDGRYTFAGWYTAKTGGDEVNTSTKFTENTTVYAHWNYTGSSGGGGGAAVTNYTLTFNTNGGSSIAKVTKSANTTIDLAAYTPTRSGYTFAGWYSDTSLTQKVTSVKLTGNITVYAKWEETVAPTPDFPFTDVTSSDYYYDAVVWAVENAVTTGDTPTTFAPNAGCTRGQIVTFLWRAAGSPAPKTTVNPFTDVSSSDYYYEAVLWAVEQEITNGTSPTTFSPNDTCTRAHAVTFLYRDAGSPAASGSNPFTDVPAGEYYSAPVLWAVANGVTTGDTPTTFAPNSTCTRGQIVTFLYRAAQ